MRVYIVKAFNQGMKNYIFKNTYDKYNYRYFKSRWILNWMEYTAKMFEQVSVSLFVQWNTILVGIFVPTLQKGRKAFLPICSCSTGLNRVRCLRGNISRWSNISPRWWIWRPGGNQSQSSYSTRARESFKTPHWLRVGMHGKNNDTGPRKIFPLFALCL